MLKSNVFLTMTMTNSSGDALKITVDDGQVVSIITVDDQYLDQVRYRFNPSGMNQVNAAKALAAGLMDMADYEGKDHRTAALGKTYAEIASMFVVKSITADG